MNIDDGSRSMMQKVVNRLDYPFGLGNSNGEVFLHTGHRDSAGPPSKASCGG